MLEEGLPEPLRNRAHGLAVDDHRVDRAAYIVDRAVTHQGGPASVRVNLELAYMAAVRPGDVLVPVQLVGRERVLCGEFADPDAAIGAGDNEPPAGVDDVLDRGFQIFPGTGAPFGDQELHRVKRRTPCLDGRTRGERTPAVRDLVGIAGDDTDL